MKQLLLLFSPKHHTIMKNHSSNTIRVKSSYTLTRNRPSPATNPIGKGKKKKEQKRNQRNEKDIQPITHKPNISNSPISMSAKQVDKKGLIRVEKSIQKTRSGANPKLKTGLQLNQTSHQSFPQNSPCSVSSLSTRQKVIITIPSQLQSVNKIRLIQKLQGVRQSTRPPQTK